MNKLFKNTSLYTVGNILPQVAGFLLLPIYTRYLNPSDYGIVTSLQVLASILTIFFTLAMERGIYRLYFDHKTDKAKADYLGTMTISIGLIAIIFLIIVFLFKDVVNLMYTSINFYPYYQYSILGAFFAVFSIVPKLYYRLIERAGTYISISLFQFVLSTSLVLWFVVEKEAGAEGMMYGMMLSNIILLPVFVFISLKTVNLTININYLKESLKFCVPMIPALLSAIILNISDRIFMERYYSFHDVGIYSLGYKMGMLVAVFSGAFFQAYLPTFYRLANSDNQKESRLTLYKYNKIFVILIILLVFLISFFAKELIVILMDNRFVNAYKIVPIIAFSYLISQVSGLFNGMIYQSKKSVMMMIIVIVSAVLNTLLNYLLIPHYGTFGAAWATLFSFLILFMLSWWYARKCYYIPLDWKSIFSLILPLIVIVIIFQFVINIDIIVSLFIKIILCVSIGLYFMKKFLPQIKEMLKRT